jgi:hypothetical protein
VLGVAQAVLLARRYDTAIWDLLRGR